MDDGPLTMRRVENDHISSSNLEVWKLALDYIDLVYKVAENLPRSEDYNLKSQITRAATSIALNIAEGSQGQSNAEQASFLGMAIRSLIETVACQKIIQQKRLSSRATAKQDVREFSAACQETSSFRKSLSVNVSS
jgi:four helix bundle protein